MQITRRLIALFVAGFVVSTAHVGWTAGFDARDCVRVLEQGIADRAFPGCTVVVGTEDRIVWSAAFGHHDYRPQTKVTPATIYDLASVTKVAGTTAVFMRLVALGKLNLADPVNKYLPEFAAAAPTPEERVLRERITVEQLLTHSAGLASWKPFYKTAAGYEAMLKGIHATPLESAPGELLRYSDLGMMLAGEVAARAGGKSLSELEREWVFDPLRMKDTLRNPPERLAARIPPTEVEAATGKAVQSVVHDENARAAGGGTGHAGLFATADDLALLAQDLLRALDGRSKLFPRIVVEDFFTGRAVGKNSVRGVGWGIVRGEPGKLARVVSHNGFTGTYLQLDLEQKRFVILLTNRVHPTRDNDKLGRVRREFLEAVQRQFAPPPAP